MKTRTLKQIFLVGLFSAGMLLTSVSAKAQATTTFNLTGLGTGNVLAGVYTSPYAGNINGGSTIPVICDDFADDSYVPESWTAYVTQGSSLSSTTNSLLKWSGAAVSGIGSLTQVQAYEVAAVLAGDILGSSSTSQEYYSYAMWALFDPNGNGSSTDLGALGQLAAYGIDSSTVVSDLDAAVNFVLNPANKVQVAADLNSITIYSYDSGAHGACGTSCSAPQEFIVVNTPEPSFFLLLALGLMFAMFLHFKKPTSSLDLRTVSVNR